MIINLFRYVVKLIKKQKFQIEMLITKNKNKKNYTYKQSINESLYIKTLKMLSSSKKIDRKQQIKNKQTQNKKND